MSEIVFFVYALVAILLLCRHPWTLKHAVSSLNKIKILTVNMLLWEGTVAICEEIKFYAALVQQYNWYCFSLNSKNWGDFYVEGSTTKSGSQFEWWLQQTIFSAAGLQSHNVAIFSCVQLADCSDSACTYNSRVNK